MSKNYCKLFFSEGKRKDRNDRFMAVYYSPEIIEEVLSRNDIVSVVSDYVKIERKGSNYWGLCPFHGEKTPSFSVTPSKQIFYCFGCHKGGNAIHFVSSIEGISYFDAIRTLAERVGMQLPEGDNDAEVQKALRKKKIIEANTDAARFFRERLFETPVAMEYFTNRGLSVQTIKKFGLGYALPEWDSLYKHLKGLGYADDLLVESGLCIRTQKGTLVDKFRDRVMFPVFDVMGKVIAFTGRLLSKEAKEQKYVNTPETIAYHKGKQLYAMNFAKKVQTTQIILVEGNMDVISLHQAGITNVVASMGTALTDSQCRLLKKHCEEVVVSYDADGAGQKATMRGLDILSKVGCRVKVISVPDGKDPDDYVRANGPDRFMALVRKAMSLVEYKAFYYTKQLDVNTLEGKVQFLDKLSQVLAEVDNMVEREMYLKRFAKQYDVSEEALAFEVAKKTKQDVGSNVRTNYLQAQAIRQQQEMALSAEKERIRELERILLALLCVDNHLFGRVKQKISPDWFMIEETKAVAEKIFSMLEAGTEVQTELLLDFVPEEVRGVYAKILMEKCVFENNAKAASDIAEKRDMIKNGLRRKELIALLANPELKEEEKQLLNAELTEILKKK